MSSSGFVPDLDSQRAPTTMIHDEQTRFPASRLAPARARAWTAQMLTAWRVAHLIDEAELLVSELVTNAVLHARTPLALRVVLADDCLRVAVTDESRWLPRPQPKDLDRVGGRGLALVEMLADQWGVEHGSASKTVWFELNRPGVSGVRA